MTNVQQERVSSRPTPVARSLRTPEQDAAERRLHRWSIAGVGVFLLIIVGALVGSVAFQSSGGRFFIVESPSMGRLAPVGSLVIDRVTTLSELSPGDVITFHPPTSPSSVYTHRIASISADGRITTRGDINRSEDGWVLSEKDLIGRVTNIAPGIGWIVRALPYLLLGGIAVWVVTLRARTRARQAAYRIAGYSLVVSITAMILRPFVGILLLSATADRKGAHASFVSTGILPIRVSAVDGTGSDLVSGQVGHMDISAATTDGHYSLSSSLNLSFWGWVIFFLLCAIPLLWTLIVGLPPRAFEDDL